MASNQLHRYQSSHVKSISGDVRVPGDKSMSHRALMLGGLANGETRITGLLQGHDVMNTAFAMRALGSTIQQGDDGIWRAHGMGIGGLTEPQNFLDLGNSGTSARLLIGLVAGYPFTTFFTGDASLVKRPMRRVMKPLENMGATFLAKGNAQLPLAVKGTQDIIPIEYETPVASAQIKSAILLAGLMAPGNTTVIETAPSRDHTENMLRAFGADVETQKISDTQYSATVKGQPDLSDCTIDIPADPSSAAFPAAAAVLQQGSYVTLRNVGINPRRIGFFECLKEMGADVEFMRESEQCGEAVADIKIAANDVLKGIDVPEERVPSMIDEFPILAVVAACADGTTKMTGLAELRVKESDRLSLMAKGLEKCGVKLEMGDDSLTIHGNGKPPTGGAFIETSLDHRIAMSFLTLGLASQEPIEIDDISPVDTSFPGFVELMNDLGANIKPTSI